MKRRKTTYLLLLLTIFSYSLKCQELSIIINAYNNPCYNHNDGSAEATINGGTAPYSYLWSNDSTTNFIYSLAAGTYSVTVEDFIGLTATESVIITEPPEITYSYTTQPASCYDAYDGEATVYIQGGVPPYEYLWPNANDTETLVAGAGNWTVTVIDDNNCHLTIPIIIEEPTELVIEPISDDTICQGQSAMLIAQASGGIPYYSFVWTDDYDNSYYDHIIVVEPNETTTYQLIVTDNNGCTSEAQTIINVLPEISIENLTYSTNEVCQGDIITINFDPTGGTGGPYTITFDGNIVNLPYLFSPELTGWHIYTVNDMCTTSAFTDSIYMTANELPEQYSVLQTPENGILQQGEVGQIVLEGSELGTSYYITSNGQVVTQDINGTGESLSLGSNFNAGTYEINSINLSSGCELIQGTIIFVNQNSILSNIFSGFKAFPNPVRDVVYFENIPQKTNYKVINTKGEIVECGILNDNKIILSKLSSGTYFIKLYKEKQEFVITKIIVE